MTEQEFLTAFRNWQNPNTVVIPETPVAVPQSPSIPSPSGDMMPATGPRNGFRAINLKNPLAFNVPELPIPQVDIPTRGAEIVRALSQQPKQLGFIGADAAGTVAGRSGFPPPPRPLSGNVPSVPSSGSTGLMSVQPVVASQNASALVPVKTGGVSVSPVPVGGRVFDGEFSRVDTRPVPQPAASGGGNNGVTRVPPSGEELAASGGKASGLGGRIVSGLAHSAVPGMAGSFASQINSVLYPQLTDRQMLDAAEAYPPFYAQNKEAIDRLYKESNNNSNPSTPKPVKKSAFEIDQESRKQRSNEREKIKQIKQEEYEKNFREKQAQDKNKHPIAGWFNTAFPQASLFLGGEEELLRRVAISENMDATENQTTAPKSALPYTETGGALSYLGSQSTPFVTKQAAETGGALSYIGNKSVEAGLADRTKGADLVANQGFTQVNNLQSSPGNSTGATFYRKTKDITADQLQKTDPARYEALMKLQALREADAAGQAKQYQQTGLTPPPIVSKGKLNEPITTIMQPNGPVTGRSLDPNAPKLFDMNNMEEYRVEVPGKGWMTGIRQKDPNRQQGTLSVMPGLSDREKQQYAEIMANEKRNAEYAAGRGKQYDATLLHNAQQASEQNKALLEFKKWQAEQQAAQQQHKQTAEKDYLNYDQKERELAARFGITKKTTIPSSLITTDENGKPSFDKFHQVLGVSPYPKDDPKKAIKGNYYLMGDGNYVYIDPNTGNPIPFGSNPQDFYSNRQLTQAASSLKDD